MTRRLAVQPDLSLNEVESLARTAARGGGRAWGLADDAGRSARWLAAQGLDWAEGLLALLDHPPPPQADPLLRGPFLADLAGVDGEYRFADIARPLWLLPPLFAALAVLGRSARLHVGAIELGGPPLLAARPPEGLATLAHAPVAVHLGGPAPLLPFAFAAAPLRPVLAQAHAARLAAYAQRTRVPASDRSRARGAGSATRDDD